jgi:CubicO group peptidase (beta-lactamase class C family)
MKLQEYLKAYERSDWFSGSVLVARDREILLHEGYGFAIRDTGVMNSANTIYGLGSVSKPITAAAVMVLNEKGTIDLDQTIDRYFPDVPEGQRITIHQLLTHTPHGTFQYSNDNYLLLARLIEKVSDMPFDSFLQQHLFEPAGMIHSGVAFDESTSGSRAMGHSAFEDRIVPGERLDLAGLSGAAGLYSTVYDLFLFDLALRDGSLLSRRNVARIFTPYSGSYGYGWHIEEQPHEGYPARRIYHGGLSDAGYFARFTRFDSERTVIITLSNFLLSPLERMNRNIAQVVLTDAAIQPPEKPETLKPMIGLDDLGRLAGTYEAFMPIPVFIDNGRLFVSIFGFKLELFLERETAERIDCFAKAACLRASFVKDRSGDIAGAEIQWLGEDGYYARKNGRNF